MCFRVLVCFGAGSFTCLKRQSLAAAVVRDGTERLGRKSGEEASNLQSITGRGVSSEIGGDTIHIGKDDLFTEVEGTAVPDEIRETVEALKTDGRTTMIVRRGDRYLGVLGLMDTPREAARGMIERLRRVGDHETIAALELILREEVRHVAIGSRWFAYLCEQRRLDAQSTFLDLLRRSTGALPRGPFNDGARLEAGFSREELAALKNIS